MVLATTPIETGITTSIDLQILDGFKDAYTDAIFKIINGLTIPDVHDDKGNYLKNNTLELIESVTHVSIETDLAKNAIILKNEKLTAKFNSQDLRYKAAPLIVAKGKASVDINRLDVEVGISFDTKVLNGSQHIIPTIYAVDVACHLDRSNIKINLSGSFVNDIANLFTVFFKGIVANTIETSVAGILNSTVPTVVNKVLDSTEGTIAIPFVPGLMFDWQTPNAVNVSESWLGVATKGLFFNSETGEEDPWVEAPTTPLHDASMNETFQNWISAYTINSLLSSIQESIQLKGWIKSEKIGNRINCHLLNNLLPGIAVYGGNQTVDIFFNVRNISQFEIVNDTILVNNTALDL